MPYERHADAQAQAGTGWIRLVELPTSGRLSGFAGVALAAADVILYEPALASIVAALLPAGGYAEALTVGIDGDAAGISTRARQLAADGWSVVQLIAPRGQNRSAPRAAAEAEAWPIVGAQPPGGRAAASANAFTANGLAG